MAFGKDTDGKPIDGEAGRIGKKHCLFFVFWVFFEFLLKEKILLKSKMSYILKLILQLLLLSKNDCSLGRNVLIKEMEADTGTSLTSGRGCSYQPNVLGPKPPGGIGQRNPWRSGHLC